ELVAYLDGELDEERSRTLETKLSLDPAARAEADALKQAWGLLDYLPRPEPSANFTNRTMERLALQPVDTEVMVRPTYQRWLVGLAWAASVLVAIGAGLVAARLVWPNHRETGLENEEQLVRHLRVLEKYHALDQVDDIDLLRQLEQPELFGD